MTTFKDFIFANLKKAGLAKSTHEEIYQIGLPYFIEAFTHSSFKSANFKNIHEYRSQQFTIDQVQIFNLKEIDGMNDYNQLEFLGDKQLNTCLANILMTRWPSLRDAHLTFAFQKITSEKYLSRYAEQNGFFEHILMSPEYYKNAVLWKENKQDQVNIKTYQRGKISNIYDKLLEDTCESFAAALVKAVDAYSGVEYGPGMNILLNWAKPLVDTIDFDPTDLSQTKAVGMVMKEMWEDMYAPQQLAKKKFKFTNYNMFIIDERQRKPGYVPIKAVDPVTRKVVAEAIGVSEQDAREQVSKLAVEWLRKYKMNEIEAGRQWKLTNKEQYNESYDPFNVD